MQKLSSECWVRGLRFSGSRSEELSRYETAGSRGGEVCGWEAAADVSLSSAMLKCLCVLALAPPFAMLLASGEA